MESTAAGGDVDRPDEVLAYKEASVVVSATPQVVYELVSDLPRMGEWSPEARGGEWKDGGTGVAGDWFVGHNKSGDREWVRESQVAVADPGRDFTFVVGGVEANCTWWSYEMEEADGSTVLTEKWWLVNKTPGVQAMSEEQFEARVAMTQESIEQTLAALKAAAEER